MIMTRVEVPDRAGLREAHVAWSRGIAREIGVQALSEADVAMDVEAKDGYQLLLWLEIAGHRLEVTAPLIAFVDDDGGAKQ